MATSPRRATGFLFIAAAVLAAVGIIIPFIRGRELSNYLIAFVIVSFLLGVVMLKGTAGDNGGGAA